MDNFTNTPTQADTVHTVDEAVEILNAHTTNTENPHKVTAAQLGLASVLVWKGIVENYSDLPENPTVGWTYSVTNGDATHAAGMNFAWNGTEWDDMGGTFKGIVRTIRGKSPDDTGDIIVYGTPEPPQTDTFYKGTEEFSDAISNIKINTLSPIGSYIKVDAPLQDKLASVNNMLTVDAATSVYYVTPTGNLTIDVSGCAYVSGYSRLVRVYIDLRRVTNTINVTTVGGTLDIVKNDIKLDVGKVHALTIEILGTGKAYIGTPLTGSGTGGGGTGGGGTSSEIIAIDTATIDNIVMED